MPKEKSKQSITLEVDIADVSPKEASDLCEYISDFIVKHYNVINCMYKVIDGE